MISKHVDLLAVAALLAAAALSAPLRDHVRALRTRAIIPWRVPKPPPVPHVPPLHFLTHR